MLPQNLLPRGKSQNPQRDLSPNLLTPKENKKNVEKVRSGVVPFANYLVLGTTLIFAVLLAVNFYYDLRLKKLTKERDDLILKIDMKKDVYDRAKYLSSLIGLYKNVKTQNADVSGSLEELLQSMGDQITYSSLSYDRNKKTYRLETNADSAASYAFFINSLLEKDFVENITLESVSLSTRAHSYTASIGVATK